MDPQLPETNPYVQYEQPRTPRSKAWQWIVLFVLLLAGTAAGVYFWQQGQVDTARREKDQAVQQAQQDAEQSKKVQMVDFTAQNLPFSFKRPANWTVQTQAQIATEKPSPLDSSYGLTMYAPGTVEVGGVVGGTQIQDGASIVLSVNAKPDFKSIDDYNSDAFKSTAKEKANVTVAGQPAVEYVYAFEGPRRIYTHFFKDGTQYTIYYEAKWNDENLKTGDNYKVYQDLVKSFTFK